MRTERHGGVEMRVYHQPLLRDRDAPRAPLASPERLDGPDPESLGSLDSPAYRESPASLASPESLGSPDSLAYRENRDDREPRVITYSPQRHATPGDEDALRPPRSTRRPHAPSRPLTRRGAKIRPRAGIHARAMPYAATPPAGTRRSSRRRRGTRRSASVEALDRAASTLYPLCEQNSAHLQTLPIEHRPLFRVIVEASLESSRKGDAPPSRRTGTRLLRELKLAHNQWLRANRESAIWPWRTAAVNFVSSLAPRLQTHRHMHDLLMACAFWCCLAHAATCSCAGLYSTHCRHLFRAFGCGGPASIVAPT
ncbi:virion protein US10 [Macacine alphaherpesvirus 3]|uniref:Virion protein US10 n=1 Tax=Macacine alphaherpesvirus 3 TaxID=2845555 RepID=A0A1X9WFE7_9ALPH|nr:virion protein US10 [Macacine alphaherpesvirus 1]ARS01857.1 virion protein US10 [Macacine alphaherpesvirus 3]